MSDTPETDATLAKWQYAGPGVHANVARKLERERDEVRKEVERANKDNAILAGRLTECEHERDSLGAEVERLKWRLNHCAENIGDLVAIRFATGASDAEIDSAMKGDK